MENMERYNLEYKEDITKTFLKTVSAYANYNDGKIIFGIDDTGNVVGINSVKDKCLSIENMINDSINPVPYFNLDAKKIDGKDIIELIIYKGKDTPYSYRGKVFRRSDTSTLEVDRFEIRRLSLEGLNMSYEERQASSQDLKFKLLESSLKDRAGIENINLDILRTLNLYSKDGYYNVAGELLADKNNISFSGVDIVRFGKDINQILYRETISKVSLLEQYNRAIRIFEQYYQYEEIDGYTRNKKELIPKEAFREAIANAIVHRVWDRNAYTQVSMYEDRVEVSSPGGLPYGITEDEYLNGSISVLRNPIIAGVFYRLNLIEQFGTGILRINNEYTNSISRPVFKVTRNNILIVLPVIEKARVNLSEDETKIYNIIKNEYEISRAEIDEKTGFNKSKTIRILNNLLKNNLIQKLGGGSSITYRLT